jgi:hypothetical protein
MRSIRSERATDRTEGYCLDADAAAVGDCGTDGAGVNTAITVITSRPESISWVCV